MKIFTALFLSALPSVSCAGSTEWNKPTLRRRLFQQEPCLLLRKTTEFEGQQEESSIVCELFGQDVEASGSFMVEVDGITPEWADSHGVVSGETTLFALGAVIHEDRLGLPQSTNGVLDPESDPIILGKLDWRSESGSSRKLTTVTGSKKLLVVRVIAADSSTTASTSAVSDSVFGTSGDLVNLKSQFEACSFGQLSFEPVANQSSPGPVVNGVINVTISNAVSGSSANTITFAVYNTAKELLKSLSPDHVMFCLPPGTSGDWIAYAYINHWLSVYNDKWCNYPSSQLHELGHNLNLGHSGEGNHEYADQSGMMGFSYSQDDTPLMCFNAAKSWQLGWYSDRHVTVNPLAASWSGELVGLADYESSDGYAVLVKINTNNETDYYVNFNRKAGINSGTLEGGDLVLVTKQGGEGSDYSSSTLVAKLNATEEFLIENFDDSGENVTISVKSINTVAPVLHAVVTVGIPDTSTPTSSPTEVVTANPSVAPSIIPTMPPSQNPSAIPSVIPSVFPSETPTQPSATPSPSSAPTMLPSMTPSASPSDFATPLPTPVPTQSPTPIPTVPPSPYPTKMPTPFPTPPPTPYPTPLPTPPPTPQPTPNPTPLPTHPPLSPQIFNCSEITKRKECKAKKGICKWKRRFKWCVNVVESGSQLQSSIPCPQLLNKIACRQQKHRCDWNDNINLCDLK